MAESDESARRGIPDGLGVDVFSVLATEPDVGVVVITSGCRLLYMNEWASRFYLDLEPAEVAGKTTDELFGSEVADLDRSNMELARRTGKPLLMRWLWKGKQVRVTLRRLAGDDEGEETYLMVHRLIRSGDPDAFEPGIEYEPHEAEKIGLGLLDSLTPREIEVMALVGQGLSIKQIAEVFGRSVKTVDDHRLSIGRKLGASDRLELAQMARGAGLRVSDAQLPRIRPKPG